MNGKPLQQKMIKTGDRKINEIPVETGSGEYIFVVNIAKPTK
jgi:hypothetical protein